MSILKRNSFASFMILLWGAGIANAAIKATVDRQSIYFGESLTLTITADKNTNSQPNFTLLDAVFHVGQTGKSSSTQISNGVVATQTTWQVLLVPKSLGSHIIPPLEVDGDSSQTIKIEVKKPDPNAQAKGDIFIELETNISSAFVQEEILLTVRLMYAINLKNGALTEPSGSGVIVQQINKGANYTTQRDGKTYQVLERKYAIFAENSGPLVLSPLVFEGEVTDNSRQSFGLFQRGRPVRKISEMLELEIKQIPQDFVNKNWIPAKQVTLQQSWSQNKPYKVGEPITRTINLTVAGLSETQLPDLTLQEVEGAKIYQDKTEAITRQDGQQLISSKVIKYAIIPAVQGSIEIPEFTLDWFDTISQTAKVSRIPASTLTVTAADASTQAPKAIDFYQDQTAKTPVDMIDPIDSSGSAGHLMWQYLTYGFAALWLMTLSWFLVRKKPQIPALEASTKQPSTVKLGRFRNASPSEIQRLLIQWWNDEHQQKATNLSQIQNQIGTDSIKVALDQLHQSLYFIAEPVKQPDWVAIIKSGQFQPKSNESAMTKGLPELYG